MFLLPGRAPADPRPPPAEGTHSGYSHAPVPAAVEAAGVAAGFPSPRDARTPAGVPASRSRDTVRDLLYGGGGGGGGTPRGHGGGGGDRPSTSPPGGASSYGRTEFRPPHVPMQAWGTAEGPYGGGGGGGGVAPPYHTAPAPPYRSPPGGVGYAYGRNGVDGPRGGDGPQGMNGLPGGSGYEYGRRGVDGPPLSAAQNRGGDDGGFANSSAPTAAPPAGPVDLTAMLQRRQRYGETPWWAMLDPMA